MARAHVSHPVVIMVIAESGVTGRRDSSMPKCHRAVVPPEPDERAARNTPNLHRTVPALRAVARPASWHRFERALAASLEALDDDHFLIIEVKGTGNEVDGTYHGARYYVQFAAHSSGLYAEAVSNGYLVGAERISCAQVKRLGQLGWLDPTHTPDTPDEQQPSDGSTNHHRDFDEPVAYGEVARQAVDTLRTVYGVTRPSSLEYTAFASKPRNQILLPGLGIDRRVTPAPADDDVEAAETTTPPLVPETPGQLREALEATIRQVTGNDVVGKDDDGDIPMRCANTVMFVRVVDDAPVVRIFAAVLREVRWGPALLDAINDINRDHRFVRAFWAANCVMLTVDIMAKPYVKDHVLWALENFRTTVDGIGDDLRRRFGGRPPLGKRSSRPQESGGYL
jgi:Putative bacterial sensory transduction regulator